ncbi:hypothetical protein Hypma_009538 [Hypsizygus marmoreus]|uniref:Uncharacterized protein n=1 Tax=Hypsizygus marmoreus TaxID=39966 RepID=A0A369JRT6_HYPMA|nr:hypothetical protein Hypma_009538 [Hypsizygus marmoreus]
MWDLIANVGVVDDVSPRYCRHRLLSPSIKCDYPVIVTVVFGTVSMLKPTIMPCMTPDTCNMTYNIDIRRTQEYIDGETPPFSNSYVMAFLIGDQCSSIPIVRVPPDIGHRYANKVDRLAFDLWVRPYENHTDPVINLAQQFRILDKAILSDGSEKILKSVFSVCYTSQTNGIENTIIRAVTDGCRWFGNMLIFKHDEAGLLVDVTMDDLEDALGAVISAVKSGSLI